MMKSNLIESDVEITNPIVKISWMWHNRKYELGIQAFLKELGINLSDEEVLAVVKKFLSKQ